MPEYLQDDEPLPPRLPKALTVVAWLLAAEGVWAAMAMLLAISDGDTSLNLVVLSIFVARGLLKLQRGWRTCGLVLLWLEMILFPLLALCKAVDIANVKLGWLHMRVTSNAGGIALLIGLFALSLWEYQF